MKKINFLNYALFLSLNLFLLLNSNAYSLDSDEPDYLGLSIDGSGVKSVVSVKVLDKLECEIQSQSNNKYRLADVFDYIGGTSSGALVALAIGCKQPLSTLLRKLDFKRIMPRTYWNAVYQYFGARFSYSTEGFENYLRETFGELRSSDLQTRVTVTSLNSQTFTPHIFRRKPADSPEDFPLWKIAQASLAVGGLFPAVHFTLNGEDVTLVDGVLFVRNTSQIVTNHIFSSSRTEQDFRENRPFATPKNTFVISIGASEKIVDTRINGGALDLAIGGNIFSYLKHGASSGVDRQLERLLGRNYLRLKPDPTIFEVPYNAYDPTTLALMDTYAEKLISQSDIPGLARRLLQIREKRNTTGILPSLPSHASQKKVILTIDGGGIRGIIPALILKRIEERTNRAICTMVDGIVGTSTGGILTLGLTIPKSLTSRTPKFTAHDLLQLYLGEQRFEIFSQHRSFGERVTSFQKLFRPGYSSTGLEELLVQKFGNFQMRDALCPIVITATEFETKRLATFSGGGEEESDYQPLEPCAQVARATSAGPSYFYPAHVTSHKKDDGTVERKAYVDGGISANNPSQIGFNRMLERAQLEDIYLISLGTGQTDHANLRQESWGEWLANFHFIPWLNNQPKKDAGIAHWIPWLVEYYMTANSLGTDQNMRALLGERYHRTQPLLNRAIGLDGVDQPTVDYLLQVAESIPETEIDRIIEMLRTAGKIS